MMKLYRIGSHVYQFEEGEQPQGAEEIITGMYQPSFQNKQGVATKARKPSNKAKEAKNK